MNPVIIKILQGAAQTCEGTIVNKVIMRVISGKAHHVEIKFVAEALDHCYGNNNGKLELTDIVSFIGNRIQSYMDAGGTVAKLFAGDTLGGFFEGLSNLTEGLTETTKRFLNGCVKSTKNFLSKMPKELRR